jgi:hypothetical protein
MPQSIYTKLTRRHRTVLGYTQLWLAADHLLLLTSSRFAEQYQRFAFTDIQAIVVTQRPPQVVLQVVMILAALAWMSLWFAVDSSFAKWTFAITGLLALLVPVIDIFRGPRCRCALQTRVSKERLAPVSRMKIARQFLAAIRPRIEAVQGTLPVEQIAAMETPSQTDELARPEIVQTPGYLPEILFATFFVNAILIILSINYPNAAEIPGVLLNTLFAEFVLIVVTLIRKGRDPRIVVYVVVGLSLLGAAFDFVTIGGELFGWYMKVFEKAKNGDKTITPLVFFPKTGIRVIVAFCWRSLAGAIGMGAAYYGRRKL